MTKPVDIEGLKAQNNLIEQKGLLSTCCKAFCFLHTVQMAYLCSKCGRRTIIAEKTEEIPA